MSVDQAPTALSALALRNKMKGSTHKNLDEQQFMDLDFCLRQGIAPKIQKKLRSSG
jgi:hypothetical protein